jgi:prephenate dehydratase
VDRWAEKERRLAKIKVAFQGARGAFSEQACRQLLGDDLNFVPCERFTGAFRALAEGEARYAVIPIENTLAGSVHENYDNLLEFGLPIIAETRVHIVHNLIGRPEAKFSDIQSVISHPVALNQCLRFFKDNPGLRSEVHYDTAGSVKTVMEGSDKTSGAIASAAAAGLYAAKLLRRSIEDNRENFTRFFLLAKNAPKSTLKKGQQAKTSIDFSVKNEPGALFRSLAAFALRDISLYKSESRPLRGRPWEYLFYLDFLGSPGEKACANALSHLGEMTDLLAVLGCYPQAV